MKKWLLLILAALIIYLNRSYAHIYDVIKEQNLKTPDIQKVYLLENNLKKAESIKYAALGDSLTAGVGSQSYQATLPYLIAKNLENNGFSVTLINISKPGSMARDVLDDQLPILFSKSPDYVTLFIGVNDIHNLISQKEFKKNYTQIIQELIQKTKAKITVINIPYLGSSQSVYFPFNLILDWRTQQFNKIIQEAVSGKPVKYIDLYTKSESFFKENPVLYSSDKFHPSAEGYKLWEQLIDAN